VTGTAIVSRQAWAPDRDVNSIAFAFALAALLQGAGNGAVKLGESEHVPQWIDSFRQVLAECLNDRALLLSVAARRMSVSPRTLQRLLEREGTTWRAEVEAVRRARAARLQRGGLSKSQVARRLGYSDARTLRRAVKRWER
jgi:AraC-like DNA-binding protein